MAIEYSLLCGDPMTSSKAIQLLAKNVPLQSRNVEDMMTLTAAGIVCTVMPQSGLGRELASETFGISTSINIVCRLDKFDLHDAGIDMLVDICLCLILESMCDMVLLSNGERGLLLRKCGKITIDCRNPFWRAKWKSTFADSGIQVEEASLPMY